MSKQKKLATPQWILDGYDSKEEYDKAQGKKSSKKSGKIFKIKVCPECDSDDVGVVLVGEEGKSARDWECRSCGWQGEDIVEKELSEEELMEHLDKKGEEIA
jgi:hypothetical protein